MGHLMFLYQELDRASGKFRAPKMAIVRFKVHGSLSQTVVIHVSSEKQARQIVEFRGCTPRWQPSVSPAMTKRPAARQPPAEATKASCFFTTKGAEDTKPDFIGEPSQGRHD